MNLLFPSRIELTPPAISLPGFDICDLLGPSLHDFMFQKPGSDSDAKPEPSARPKALAEPLFVEESLTQEESALWTWLVGTVCADSRPLPRCLQRLLDNREPGNFKLGFRTHPGAFSKPDIRDAVSDGYLFVLFTESLLKRTLQGCHEIAETYAARLVNWRKALSLYRTNVKVPLRHLFSETLFSSCGNNFLDSFFELLFDIRSVYPDGPYTDYELRGQKLLQVKAERFDGNPSPLSPATLACHPSGNVYEYATNITGNASGIGLTAHHPQSRAYSFLKLKQFTPDPMVVFHGELQGWLLHFGIADPEATTTVSLEKDPWRNGLHLMRILSRLYFSFTEDKNIMEPPHKHPLSAKEATENVRFALQLANKCGISPRFTWDWGSIVLGETAKLVELLTEIAKRYPIVSYLSAEMPYTQIEMSLLEQSICSWIYQMGFLSRTPYEFTNIPTLERLMPHAKAGVLFCDVTYYLYSVRAIKRVAVSIDVLRNVNRTPTIQSACLQNIDIGLRTFRNMVTCSKEYIEKSNQEIYRMTQTAMLLLMEDIHRAADGIQTRYAEVLRHGKPSGCSGLTNNHDKKGFMDPTLKLNTSVRLMSGVQGAFEAREPNANPDRGLRKEESECVCNHKGNTTVRKRARPYMPYAPYEMAVIRKFRGKNKEEWSPQSEFIRPPDEAMCPSHVLIPTLWVMPEIKPYPFSYDFTLELVDMLQEPLDDIMGTC